MMVPGAFGSCFVWVREGDVWCLSRASVPAGEHERDVPRSLLMCVCIRQSAAVDVQRVKSKE